MSMKWENMPEPKLSSGGLVLNWQEIRDWSTDNDALWHSTEREAREYHLSEDDTLRLLVVRLAKDRHQMITDELEAARQGKSRFAAITQ